MAVKQVRVSDLSGQQADEEQFAKLIVHEHPQYQGPITLDVLPEEIGELPESEQYVSIEVIQPGERSGQRALLSVDRFNKLAASGDMNSILMNAVTEQQPRYKDIRVPTVIISGSADGIVWTDVHSRGLAREVSGARLIILPGVGHMPHHAAPDRVIAEIDRLAAMPAHAE